MKKSLLWATLSLVSAGLWADQGTTAAAFLKLQVGPRAIAMAESFAGLADDVNALNYNASGTAFMKEKQVTVMHAVWLQDMFYDNIGVAWPMEGIGTIGLSVLYLNGGEFDKTVIDPLTSLPQSQGKFTAGSFAVGLAYARAIVPTISAGLHVKMISETIETASTSGFAADLSSTYKTPVKGLSVGLNIMNLGPSMGFDQAFSMPINVRLGVGYRLKESVLFDVDYTQPIETAGIFSGGFDYGYRGFLNFRAGYKYQGAVDFNQTFTGFGPAVASGLTFGLGINYKQFSLDYAYANYGFLGTPHRVAITAKFN